MNLPYGSRHAGSAVINVAGRLSLAQRHAPRADNTPVAEHRLIEGETLDLLALRYYGQEELWWRIADANPSRFPLDWVPGDLLRIPLGPNVTRASSGAGP